MTGMCMPLIDLVRQPRSTAIYTHTSSMPMSERLCVHCHGFVVALVISHFCALKLRMAALEAAGPLLRGAQMWLKYQSCCVTCATGAPQCHIIGVNVAASKVILVFIHSFFIIIDHQSIKHAAQVPVYAGFRISKKTCMTVTCFYDMMHLLVHQFSLKSPSSDFYLFIFRYHITYYHPFINVCHPNSVCQMRHSSGRSRGSCRSC